MRLRPWLLVAGLLVAGLVAAAPASAGQRRLAVVLLDGGSAPVLERLMGAGAMPHLAAMRAAGASGKLSAGAPDWAGALSAGARPVLALGVPAPGDASVGWVRLEAPAAEAGAIEALAASGGEWRDMPASHEPPQAFTFTIAGRPVYALAIDDPKVPATGYDTLVVASEPSGRAVLARLRPAGPLQAEAWSGPVGVMTPNGPAETHLRLFELSPDGRRLSLVHTPPRLALANRAGWLEALHAVGGLGPWAGLEALYRQRGFGATLAEGGDGTAEARYLDTVRFAVAQARRGVVRLAAKDSWQVLLTGLPFPGEAARMWLGYLTPGSPAYQSQIAAKLDKAFQQVAREVDGYVADLRAGLPGEAALAVVGTQGVAPVRWNFRPQVALRRAGLRATLAAEPELALRAEGPDELAAAASALEALRVKTPRGVVPIVRSLVSDDGLTRRFALQAGYALDLAEEAESVYQARLPNASGASPADPGSAWAAPLMVVSGPGIKRGAAIGASADEAVGALRTYLGLPSGPSRGAVESLSP